MYKRWFFGMVCLCCISIALSCIWLIAPRRLAANYPILSQSYYQLTDHGGYVHIAQVKDGTTEKATTPTELLVNLLPEQDALRIKAGYRLADEAALSAALSALRSGKHLPEPLAGNTAD